MERELWGLAELNESLFCDLDDPRVLNQHDAERLWCRVGAFPTQCREGYRLAGRIGRRAGSSCPPRTVVIFGLGGSAAAGDLLVRTLEEGFTVPVFAWRGYRLPKWVNQDTICLVVSYSGNTQEAVDAFHESRCRGARTIVVSSGGDLTRLALAHHCPLILNPRG